MRVRHTMLSVSLAALVAATASAQQSPGNVTQVIRQKAAPGMADKYEAGRKKHMDWHRKMADPWGWSVGQITTGPDTGSYIIVTGNHEWQDLDSWVAKMGEGDTADAQANIGAYQGSSATSYWVRMPDYSRMPAAGADYPMSAVTYFYVKPGGADAFLDAIKKVGEATAKANWTRPAIWYRLANGGEGGTFAVVNPRKNMADMAPPTPSMSDVVEKHMGKAAADAMWKSFYDSIRHSTSEMIEWRPDLSYQPAAK